MTRPQLSAPERPTRRSTARWTERLLYLPAVPVSRHWSPGRSPLGREVGQTTASVSVQGRCLAGSRDHAMGGGGGEPCESLCGVVAVTSAVTDLDGYSTSITVGR